MDELKPCRTYNPCDECPYGVEKRDGSGNDSMCKICEFSELLNLRAEPENKPLTLERFEAVCEAVHNGWWEECKRQGRTNHPDMIPYAKLSEPVKEYDRVTVRHVLDALGIAYAHKPENQ